MAVLTHVNNDVVRIKNDVDAVSAAVTLTAADSGKWYELAASAGVTVTLPADVTKSTAESPSVILSAAGLPPGEIWLPPT